VKVIKRFKDKHTNLLHGVGQELEIAKERYEEINSTSLGVFVEEIVVKAEEKKKKSTKK